MQALILLWADYSGVIRFTALRRPGAGSLREYTEDIRYLGWSILVMDISRRRPLTILDDGRAMERLAKAQGPINAAAALKREATLYPVAELNPHGSCVKTPENTRAPRVLPTCLSPVSRSYCPSLVLPRLE